jgi:hypothetical protein
MTQQTSSATCTYYAAHGAVLTGEGAATQGEGTTTQYARPVKEYVSDALARIRGYLSTIRKRGVVLLAALQATCTGHPLYPALG